MTRRECAKALSAALGSALVVAACGGGPGRAAARPELEGKAPFRDAPRSSDGNQTSEQVSLTFAYMARLAGIPTEASNAIGAWHAENIPGPTRRAQLEAVEIRRPSGKSWRDAFWEFVVARDASGIPLDIAWMHAALDFPRAFTHQILAPLERYAQTDDTELLDSFSFKALQLTRYQRQLMGIPLSVLPAMVMYNSNKFKEYKVEEPARTWNHEDFIATAKSLTRDDDGDTAVDFWGYAEWSIPGWLPYVLQEGGNAVDLDTGEIKITERAALRGIQFWQDIGRIHKAMPHGPDLDSNTLRGTINGERLQTAMILNPFYGRLRADRMPAVIPKEDRGGTPLGLQEALVMPVGSRNGDAGFSTMLHLGHHLGQNRLVPAITEAQGYVAKPDGQHMSLLLDPVARDVLLDLLVDSVPSHLATSTQMSWRVFSNLTLPVARGQISIEEAAQNTQVAIEEYLTPKPPPTPVPEQSG
jgi:hypothetical protein